MKCSLRSSVSILGSLVRVAVGMMVVMVEIVSISSSRSCIHGNNNSDDDDDDDDHDDYAGGDGDDGGGGGDDDGDDDDDNDNGGGDGDGDDVDRHGNGHDHVVLKMITSPNLTSDHSPLPNYPSNITNLLVEIDEVVPLINQKKLQRAPAQVVPPQVNLPQLRQSPQEVLASGLRLAVLGEEVDMRSGELEPTGQQGHQSDQLAVDQQNLLLCSVRHRAGSLFGTSRNGSQISHRSWLRWRNALIKRKNRHFKR